MLIDDDDDLSGHIGMASSSSTSFNVPIGDDVDPEPVNGSPLPAVCHDQQRKEEKIRDFS